MQALKILFWKPPVAVLLSVAVAVLGAMGMNIDLYVQTSMVVLIALAVKKH